MKRFKVNLFVCVVAAVLLALLLAPAAAQGQAAPWTIVKSPNASSGNNELFGAASISATDVWAVGEFTTASGVMQPLTLHWNGRKWSIVKSPTASSGNNTLRAVAAVSINDVWAVGSFIAASGSGQALIEHWDGKKWSVVASPTAGMGNVLLGVAAVTTTDVWAVGTFALTGSGIAQTLIEHWDGTSWSVVSSPNASTQTNELAGVTAVSANDIWAVGQFNNGTGPQTLIERWNGTSWSVVPSPNASTDDNLLAAAAVSTTDVWAVGQFVALSGVDQALIEHWDGTSWNVVSSPSAGGSNVLSGVAIISATDIWAVGDVVISSLSAHTLIEQWNGTSWSVVSSPNPSSAFNVLDAAAADKSSGQAWVVGQSTAASGAAQTLTEFNP